MKNLIKKILNEELNDQKKRILFKIWDSSKDKSVIPKINWDQITKMKLLNREFDKQQDVLDLYSEYVGVDNEKRFEYFVTEYEGDILDETFFEKNGVGTNGDKFKFEIVFIEKNEYEGRFDGPQIDITINVDLTWFEIQTPDGRVTDYDGWDDDSYIEWESWFRYQIEGIMEETLGEYNIQFTNVYVQWT